MTKSAALLALLFGLSLSTIAPAQSFAGPSTKTLRTTRPSDETLKQELTPLQFQVTRQNATERPFQNAYWNHHEDGIYVDVTTGQPLFSSKDKFDSGTGWPSFFNTLDKSAIVWKLDKSHGSERTEVRSAIGDAHLGHVFDDGPKPTGLRYCINSASIRFVPAAQLVAQGYGKYASLFPAKQNWFTRK